MKTNKTIYIALILVIIIAVVCGYLLHMQGLIGNQGIQFAETFLRSYYTVDNEDINTLLILQNEENLEQVQQQLKKEYSSIMSEKTYKDLAARRVILGIEEIMYDNNCTLDL